MTQTSEIASPKIEALNSVKHANIKIQNAFLPGLGYEQGAVMIAPGEIQNAQREYPLLFRKHHQTGRFFLNALLGFSEHENLYMGSQGKWLADYIPLAIQKGPFLIGFEQDGKHQKAILSLNVADPRVSENAGNPLFDAEGNPSTYLNNINQVLAAMHETSHLMQEMVDEFLSAELIEPLTLNVNLQNGEQVHFEGAYTVAEEKLRRLSASALENLNQKGYLSAAFYIAGSLQNVSKLIQFKNNNG